MMTAQSGERAAQLRLKDDHQRDSEKRGQAPNNPADHNELQQLRDQREGEKNYRETRENLRATRAAEVEIAIIDRRPEQRDLDRRTPVLFCEIKSLLPHTHASRIASIIRSASRFS